MKVPKRAFGVTLHPDEIGSECDSFSGASGNLAVELWATADATWRAALRITSLGVVHEVTTDLSSASPAAAIKNLRGAVANLALDLQRSLSTRRAP